MYRHYRIDNQIIMFQKIQLTGDWRRIATSLLPIIITILNLALAMQIYGEETPATDYLRGETVTYTTANHRKAKGLDVRFTLPKSWIGSEGNRPNVVQSFNTDSFGDASLSIGINDGNGPKDVHYTDSDVLNQIKESDFQIMFPGSEIIEHGVTRIDNVPTRYALIYWDADKAGMKTKIIVLFYMIFYKDKVINFQFAVSDVYNETRERLFKKYEKFRSLFQLIANSIIIYDQWKR